LKTRKRPESLDRRQLRSTRENKDEQNKTNGTDPEAFRANEPSRRQKTKQEQNSSETQFTDNVLKKTKTRKWIKRSIFCLGNANNVLFSASRLFSGINRPDIQWTRKQ